MGTFRSLSKAPSSRKLSVLQIQQPFRHAWGPGCPAQPAEQQTEQPPDSRALALAVGLWAVGTACT